MTSVAERATTAGVSKSGRVRSHVSVFGLIGVLLIGLDSSQPASAVVSEPAHSIRAQLVVPSALESSKIIVDQVVRSDARAPQTPVELTVQSGDTLITLLGRSGVVMSDAYAAVRALHGVFSARDLRADWTVRLTLQEQDPPRLATLASVAFRPSAEREIRIVRSESSDESDPFVATTISHPLRHVPTLSAGTIDNSLFNTAMASGVPNDLLAEAVAAFSYDVDFQRDIHVGDRFELFYDTLNDDKGQYAKSGELYYAKLVLRGKERQYYRFTSSSGVSDLFSPDGHSIRKALLQTPVDATRISSGFGMRMHPILGYSMMHRGVDFAVPWGTPVRAAGDGVVVVAGNAGSYGNYVRIQHNSKYQTAYAHLSGFARGVSKGSHVHQGEVIAYVGATGRATGPHLHYEVLIDGSQVNPRSVRLPSGEQLAGADLARFKARLQQIEAMRASHRIGGGATIAEAPSGGCSASARPVPSLAVSLGDDC